MFEVFHSMGIFPSWYDVLLMIWYDMCVYILFKILLGLSTALTDELTNQLSSVYIAAASDVLILPKLSEIVAMFLQQLTSTENLF